MANVHIQSKEYQQRIVNQFCSLMAVSSLASVIVYLYLKIYTLAFATAIVGALFLFFVYLNKKSGFKISRIAIVITTILGVIFFSFYLGYESGIYLYLFLAPLLIYLLFDFNERRWIIGFVLLYLLTFLVIYLNQKSFSNHSQLTKESLNLIYSFNFCCSILFCFGMVTYFANNNFKYISNLIAHQELLTEEIALRNKSEGLLKRSLDEREILLAEVHHRVKNNLAIISALINMQINKLTDDSSKEIFEETKNRIYAMSLIHNLLYQNKSFSNIDFSEYLDSFCNNISKSYQTGTKITIVQEVDPIKLNIKTAIPLALVLNELLTNSFKHAFGHKTEGRITVGLKKVENELYRFWVSDTGVGMEEEKIYRGSTGMDIIKSLSEQIDGKIEYLRDNGSTFILTLPLPVLAD